MNINEALAKRRFGKEKDEDLKYQLCKINPFELDAEKIKNSKAFRRLAFKTQVFSMPSNAHVRTRLVHTFEVVSCALNMSRALGLDSQLCKAIAYGHDIGHTPFGHIGERVLTELGGKEFRHEIFSVVVAQYIERKGLGLNLCYGTLEGILNHSLGSKDISSGRDMIQEYACVMIADKIAYVFSDINDCSRNGLITNLPDEAKYFGENQRERVYNACKAVIEESEEKGFVSFRESEEASRFNALKRWMYENVYSKIRWRSEKEYLHALFEFLSDDERFEGTDPVIAISLMTDGEAEYLGKMLLEKKTPTEKDISGLAVHELIPYLKGKDIDYTNPGLSW